MVLAYGPVPATRDRATACRWEWTRSGCISSTIFQHITHRTGRPTRQLDPGLQQSSSWAAASAAAAAVDLAGMEVRSRRLLPLHYFTVNDRMPTSV